MPLTQSHVQARTADTYTRRSRQRGFTVVELLVVVGLIGLLTGLTLAGITAVRRRASDLICENNLRQLVAASTMYLNDWNCYPPFLPDASYTVPTVDPSEIDLRLLNAVGHYLNVPTVNASMTIDQLPAVMMPPLRTDGSEFLPTSFDPLALWGVDQPAFWYTGYMYGGTIDVPDNQGAVKIDRTHITNPRGTRRGVLWADQGCYWDWGDPNYNGFSFWHVLPGVLLNDGDYNLNPKCILGMHRAWTDGSVEWLSAADVGLAADPNPQRSTYQFGSPGEYDAYWHF